MKRALILLAAAVGLGGCSALGLSSDSGGDAGAYDPCNSAGPSAEVAGVWHITGSGSRSGCDREELDAKSFAIDSVPLTVTQNPPDLIQLVAPTENPTFGEVFGICVNFDTEEETSFGKLKYKWSAKSNGSKQLTGTLSGEGPGNCRSSGTFTVTIQ